MKIYLDASVSAVFLFSEYSEEDRHRQPSVAALFGLITRTERLLHKKDFEVLDPSDQPHAICARVNKCDAIVTYDSHFVSIKDKIEVFAPEEFMLQYRGGKS